MPDKPDKALAAEEAALAADVSATHAEKAVEQAALDAEEAAKAADKNRPPCPHCGRLLRYEHDLGDHLHCDSKECVSCCFDPGDPPTLREHSAICPAAG